MRRRWLTRSALLALGCAAALAVAACGGDDDSADTSTSGGGGSAADDVAAVVDALGGAKDFGTPEKGGTYRIENTDFALFDAFDPTGEYFGSDWTIYSNLMLRTLVSYNFSSSAEGGNDPVPDLATEIPEPTDGGKTWTFTIKDGIKFGPPVNRADHLEGHQVRDRAHRDQQGRPRLVRELLPPDHRHRGHGGRDGPDRQRHHDAGRPDHRLQAEGAGG